jgi:hypothetical protein
MKQAPPLFTTEEVIEWIIEILTIIITEYFS